MPAIQQKDVITANSTVRNILAGNNFEFLPYTLADVLFGFNQSATGLLVSVFTGGDLITDDYEPLISGTYPDNEQMDFDDKVEGGERIVVKVVNTTGGDLDLYTRIVINPLA